MDQKEIDAKIQELLEEKLASLKVDLVKYYEDRQAGVPIVTDPFCTIPKTLDGVQSAVCEIQQRLFGVWDRLRKLSDYQPDVHGKTPLLQSIEDHLSHIEKFGIKEKE